MAGQRRSFGNEGAGGLLQESPRELLEVRALEEECQPGGNQKRGMPTGGCGWRAYQR